MSPTPTGILWVPQMDAGIEHMKPVLTLSDSLESGLTGFTSTRVKNWNFNVKLLKISLVLVVFMSPTLKWIQLRSVNSYFWNLLFFIFHFIYFRIKWRTTSGVPINLVTIEATSVAFFALRASGGPVTLPGRERGQNQPLKPDFNTVCDGDLSAAHVQDGAVGAEVRSHPLHGNVIGSIILNNKNRISICY